MAGKRSFPNGWTLPLLPILVSLVAGCGWCCFRPSSRSSRLGRRAGLVEAERFWAKKLPRFREKAQSLGVPYLPEPGTLPSWASPVIVVPHQVQRDLEQLEYLVARGVLNSELENYVAEFALPEFQLALKVVNQALEGTSDDSAVMEPNEHLAVFFGLYGRLLHLHPGKAMKTDIINPQINFEAVQTEFRKKRHRVVVIDDVFSEEGLQELRNFLLESTMWMDVKRGYVGAYLHTGFASPLVAQVEQEIRRNFADLLEGLVLQNAWAYMYDGNLPGIGAHADDSQLQINIYVTPSEANLWTSDATLPSGGLVLYGVGPPKEWGFEKYNSESKNSQIQEILQKSDWNLTIPYLQNRAILFDSTYFHKTDEMRFREGYTNRRINLTFLYGRRERLVPAPAVA